MHTAAIQSAILLRDKLQQLDARIVLAESCTAGRIAATLSCLPGISSWLCGSFVVYRPASKIAWLDLSSVQLNDPEIGPESAHTTRALAQAALKRTPEARFSLAITGHIGPGAPIEKDGVCYCALLDRNASKPTEQQLKLQSPVPESTADIARRTVRLEEATELALTWAADAMNATCQRRVLPLKFRL